MKDRFLFRGKRFDSGKWVTGCYSLNIDGIENVKDAKAVQHPIVDPATIGQCTGLKDKNGNLIFEGDIFKQSNSVVCVVEWLNDSWNAYYRPLILHVSDGIEIIGNIYDNPELLSK